MSAVFSALKDIDGIEKAKNKSAKKEKSEAKNITAKSAMKLEST